MKKLLVLLTLMVGVFGLSAAAFSQDVCESCKNGSTVRHIPCAGVQEVGCAAFDYDSYYGDGSGYCTGSNDGNYRAIFNICNCEGAATDFAAGNTIGVRMTILVNGQTGERGAYWATGASANVAFGAYSSTTAACAGTTQDRDFGAGTFYKSNLTTVVSSLASTCPVLAANQATVILTDLEAGYMITDQDEVDKLSHWWIDIAPIRIDPAVLHNGETISVRIELMNQASGGICADCVSVCECTIDVAIVCCTTTSSYSMLFPYFAASNTGYWNGMVIANLGATDGTAVLNAYQNGALAATISVPVKAHEMYINFVDQIAWVGTLLETSPCYIQVTTDFAADGFAMMSLDTVNSMGYLPRLPSAR